MKDELLVISIGVSGRLSAVLHHALAGRSVQMAAPEALPPMQGRRVLIAISLDETGINLSAFAFLAFLRRHSNCMENACVAMMIDGCTELYTKQLGQMLLLAVNQAGAWLMGKPLLEATGSLQNLTIRARHRGLLPEQVYPVLAAELMDRLQRFQPPKLQTMRLLMLHASNQSTSNTLALGHRVVSRLPERVQVQERCIRNGAVQDCNGCSYAVCAHFAERGGCFYGSSLVKDVFPAILESDALLMLCPNYNDALSANLTALINRLTSLTVNNQLEGKLLYGIVVSGYSGGDVVAQQLLGALCLNKAFSLPPRCCWMETANDPLAVLHLPHIPAASAAFAERICACLA